MVDLVAENPSAEILEIELDWDKPRDTPRPTSPDDSSPDRVLWWRSPRSGSARRRLDPRWLTGIAVLAFVFWVLGGRAPADDPSASAVDRPVPTAETTTDTDVLPDPALDLAANIAGLTEKDLVTAWLEVQVDPDEVDKYALLRPVEMMPSDYRFAFMGADGFPVVIDLGTGDLVSVRTEVRAEGDAGEAVLITSDGALGFASSDPTQAMRLAIGVQLVRRHTGELLVLAATEAGIEYGGFVPGGTNERSLLPSNGDIDIVPGVGVFVTAQTGGTLEVTADGLERVTPHEIVTTNGTRWLEYRRSTTDANKMVVTTAGGAAAGEYTLDNDLLDFGLGPAISPDGKWIFLPKGREVNDFPALYEIETGELLDFEQRVQGLESVWAPDSSFVAMIDPRRDCIYLFFTSGNNGCVSLSRLQIPAVADSNLVIFPPVFASPEVASDTSP